MTHDGTFPPAAQPESSIARSAFLDKGSHIRLWTVAVATLAIDLWSKSWAFDHLSPTDIRTVIPGVLTFRRSVNPGALFGMGKGLVPLFIVASIVALVFVVYLFASSSSKRKSLHIALAFVLAGSLGNLYDRAFIIADRITVPGAAEPIIGKVVDDDPASPFIEIGAAPDGAMPRKYSREGVVVTQVGVVRDFLKIEPKIGKYDVWPWVFNIADSLLVAGVTLLMINFWLERRAMDGVRAISPVDVQTG